MIISKRYIPSSPKRVSLNGEELTVPGYSFGTLVVGSGAAGLNCADLIGEDTAVVTEGLYMGTSRNTGSDKQTYYKLTLSGDAPDSVGDMARSYFDGGAMDGDLAVIEAAGSTRAFMRLVELGVPFPCNDFGEFAGYRTDHDAATRATSCGPLTSKYMTEALTKAVRSKDIPIFDGFRVVKLIMNGSRAVGFAAICAELAGGSNPYGLALFYADSIVWAAGGPSAIYASTVYPESQTCAHGVLLEAGAAAVNVTESQYGLASVKFRWNLSGTYQQALPRYYSTAPDGTDEREFADGYFESTGRLLTAAFRKGYQWPFDPAKLDRASGNDSSLMDIAVFRERQAGRRVFMDFRRNPSRAELDGSLDISLLADEPRSYLESSGALLGTPIERLAAMNPPAIELYKSHGIDLYSEPLELDMCAQHNNGGFAVDTSYRSTSVEGLYIIGEAAGVFGIHRPGGSALNSTQVGGRRAAEDILMKRRRGEHRDSSVIPTLELPRLAEGMDRDAILAERRGYGERMSSCGAFMRDRAKLERALTEVSAELDGFGAKTAADPMLTVELCINRDILITEYIYIAAILEYIADGGKSRGSYLIIDGEPETAPEIDRSHFGRVCEVTLTTGGPEFAWRDVRPLPERENWFERVYNSYREKQMN